LEKNFLNVKVLKENQEAPNKVFGGALFVVEFEGSDDIEEMSGD
tara:strand:- start:300 stop:431 length:132 start_codon:yes stop_codon:yes gene_type:complete